MTPAELHEFAKDKTVDRIVVKKYCTGQDGAMEKLLIAFTDSTAIILHAGSYCIPEEACIYGEMSL